MGHYRGRAKHKSRKAARRKLERRSRPVYGPSPLQDAIAAWSSLRLAASSFAEHIRAVGLAAAEALRPLVSLIAEMAQSIDFDVVVGLASADPATSADEEINVHLFAGDEVSLDVLRDMILSDGAKLDGVRFTAEGGFSFN